MSDPSEESGPNEPAAGGNWGLAGPHALSLLVTAGLFLVMLVPIPADGLEFDVGIPYTDKVAHFLVFFGWAAAARRSLRAARVPGADLWVIALALGLGALLEVLQGAGSYRQPELLDLIADAAGAIIYVVLVRFLDRLR